MLSELVTFDTELLSSLSVVYDIVVYVIVVNDIRDLAVPGYFSRCNSSLARLRTLNFLLSLLFFI